MSVNTNTLYGWICPINRFEKHNSQKKCVKCVVLTPPVERLNSNLQLRILYLPGHTIRERGKGKASVLRISIVVALHTRLVGEPMADEGVQMVVPPDLNGGGRVDGHKHRGPNARARPHQRLDRLRHGPNGGSRFDAQCPCEQE